MEKSIRRSCIFLDIDRFAALACELPSTFCKKKRAATAEIAARTQHYIWRKKINRAACNPGFKSQDCIACARRVLGLSVGATGDRK